MTGRPHDKLNLLSRLPTPEPDELRRETVIAAAGRRLAQLPARPAVRTASGLPQLLAGWRSWTAPLAAGFAALALVAVYLGPLGGLDRQEAAPQLADSGTAPQEPPASTTFGARPMPQGEPLDLDADLIATVRHHVFDDLEIVSRSTPDTTTLALLRDGVEIPFDTRMLDPGTDFALLDAFIAPGDPELLLMRSRMDAHINWDAFTIEGNTITLSGRLSLLIHDAPDRADVIERLAKQ